MTRRCGDLPASPFPRVSVSWLGRIDFDSALRLQEERVALRQAGTVNDALFLLEHPPVITLGRGADERHVLWGEIERRRNGIELRRTRRGGDVTYHGPGQLVGYPVIELPPDRRDVHRYLRDLEEVLIRTLGDFGIRAGRYPGYTGVWVEGAKIAAIGVRVARWVTSHGFALNVDPDLSHFDSIVPCGIAHAPVTSMARVLGRAPAMKRVVGRLVLRFDEVLLSGGSRSLLRGIKGA